MLSLSYYVVHFCDVIVLVNVFEKKIRCLNFHDLVQFKTLLVTYKTKIDALPSGLQNMFTECNHSYNTRSSMKGNFFFILNPVVQKRDLLILVILM